MENYEEQVVSSTKVTYTCDQCNEGEMITFNDIVLTSNPPKYPHKCTNCGHNYNFTERYPYVKLNHSSQN